jgi:hypothetical protein
MAGDAFCPLLESISTDPTKDKPRNMNTRKSTIAAFTFLTLFVLAAARSSAQEDNSWMNWDPYKKSKPATAAPVAPATPDGQTTPTQAAPTEAAPAQTAPPSTESVSPKSELASAPRNYQPFTIGGEIGTTGIGGAARWRFSNHFGVRVGGDYLEYSGNKTYSGVDYSGDLRLLSAPITLDYFPWKNRSFYISLGMAINENRLTGTATPGPGQTIQIGNGTYTGAQIGTLDLKIQPMEVSPYLTIGGNFYFDKGHHVSIGTELGVMYGGNPDVTLSATGPINSAPGFQQNLSIYKQQIQNDANYAKFWPVIKLSLNYSF